MNMGFDHSEWHKSSYSDHTEGCVEIAWRKSSYSTETEACVEIAHADSSPMVGIRDSKNPTAGNLTLPAFALHHLTGTVRQG
jgi:hypothetical protein